MHPDLVVAAYRHQERELEQRLHHRRVALERAESAGLAPASTRPPSPAAGRSVARRVTATWHGSRQAVADAYGPTDCCAAA